MRRILMELKIKKGDTVEVISGKLEEKGKRGEVNGLWYQASICTPRPSARFKHRDGPWLQVW
jgi:hypothetical protein